MTTPQRAGLGALCVLCAAETAAIIAYYGTPLLRLTLAALITLAVLTGMITALRAARRGDPAPPRPRPRVPTPVRPSARVHHLPGVGARDHYTDKPVRGQVIQLDSPRR